jgi:hypothetical protein
MKPETAAIIEAIMIVLQDLADAQPKETREAITRRIDKIETQLRALLYTNR